MKFKKNSSIQAQILSIQAEMSVEETNVSIAISSVVKLQVVNSQAEYFQSIIKLCVLTLHLFRHCLQRVEILEEKYFG